MFDRLAFLPFFGEVPGSNFGLENIYHDFCDFSVFQVNFEMDLKQFHHCGLLLK
jgi:hypothetical protein